MENFNKEFFGYKRDEVNEKLKNAEVKIKTQKKDIEYLKKIISEFKIEDSSYLDLGIVSLSFITGYKDTNYFNKHRTCLIGKRGGIKVTTKNKKGYWKNKSVSLFDFMTKYYF